MGVSHSTTVQNTAEFLSSVTFNTVATVQQSCQNNATGVQSQVVSVGTSDAVMLACNAACQAGGWNPASCAALQSNGLKVYNISQTGKVTQITKCSLDSKLLSTMQDDIANQIQQQLAKTTDGITGDVKSFIQLSTNTNDTTLNSTTVKNFVNQNFTFNAMQTAVNTVATTQAQALTVGNAQDTTVHDISQAVQVESILTLLQSNSATASAITKLDSNASQSLSQTDRGIADIFSTLAGVFNNLIGTLGVWIYAVYGVCALLVLCSCVCVFMSLRSGGDGKPAAAAFLPTSDGLVKAAGALKGL